MHVNTLLNPFTQLPISISMKGFFSQNQPNGPIRSSSRDVRPFVQCHLLCVVPFPCDSPRGAKEVPGEQSRLSLALRSHDQILASHWSPTFTGFSLGFPGVFDHFCRRFCWAFLLSMTLLLFLTNSLSRTYQLLMTSQRPTTFRLQCELCGKDIQNLDGHLKKLRCKKQFPCNICDEKFRTQTDLKKHTHDHVQLNNIYLYIGSDYLQNFLCQSNFHVIEDYLFQIKFFKHHGATVSY